jgi:hypothetical protein
LPHPPPQKKSLLRTHGYGYVRGLVLGGHFWMEKKNMDGGKMDDGNTSLNEMMMIIG